MAPRSFGTPRVTPPTAPAGAGSRAFDGTSAILATAQERVGCGLVRRGVERAGRGVRLAFRTTRGRPGDSTRPNRPAEPPG